MVIFHRISFAFYSSPNSDHPREYWQGRLFNWLTSSKIACHLGQMANDLNLWIRCQIYVMQLIATSSIVTNKHQVSQTVCQCIVKWQVKCLPNKYKSLKLKKWLPIVHSFQIVFAFAFWAGHLVLKPQMLSLPVSTRFPVWRSHQWSEVHPVGLPFGHRWNCKAWVLFQ